MVLVDTNVLIHAADRECAEYAACRGLIERLRAQPLPWYLTWPVIYEFLRVTTHPRVMRRPWGLTEAWGFVSVLLDSPGLAVIAATERHAEVAAQVIAELPHLAGNLLHDTHTAILMREHGIRRIVTRDTDFHRFPFLEPLDPAA